MSSLLASQNEPSNKFKAHTAHKAPNAPTAPASRNMYLFGGDRPWDASHFTASDDRVRGGKSQSYLTVLPGPPDSPSASRAEFSGHLDITALGGAGFASQRTADDFPSRPWDVSGYHALVLDVDIAGCGEGDEATRPEKDKKYTLTLKDEVLPRRPDGRDQSTISWEYDFFVGGAGSDADGETNSVLVIPFEDFKPTYRGRPKPDADPLDLSRFKRLSFMMRSFFGEQEGDFSIIFNSVSVQKRNEEGPRLNPTGFVPGPEAGNDGSGLTSWIGRLLGWG